MMSNYSAVSIIALMQPYDRLLFKVNVLSENLGEFLLRQRLN